MPKGKGSRRREKDRGKYNLFLRYSRLILMLEALDEYPVEHDGAFMARALLATGHTRKEIFTWKTENVWEDFNKGKQAPKICCNGRVCEVMPEFAPYLLLRKEMCLKTYQEFLFTDPDELGIMDFIKSLFKGMGLSDDNHTSSPTNRLRMTAFVAWAALHKHGRLFLATQAGMPYGSFEWIFKRKQEVIRLFLGGQKPKAVPVNTAPASGLPTKGEQIMEPLKYFTDPELCQIYLALPILERKRKWRRACFLVRLALGSGLRSMEIRQLTYNDVLLDEEPPVLMVRNGKGGKARHVQVIPEFAPYLREWVQKGKYPNALLLPSITKLGGRDLTPRGLAHLWYGVLDACKIRKVGIHTARHTFATWETQRLNMFQLQAALGHGSLLTTSAYYVHPIMGMNYNKVPKWYATALDLYDDNIQEVEDVIEFKQKVISYTGLEQKDLDVLAVNIIKRKKAKVISLRLKILRREREAKRKKLNDFCQSRRLKEKKEN